MDKISAINRHLEMKSELRHLNPPPFGHCVFALGLWDSPSLHQQMKDRSALLLRFTSLLIEVMILKESSPQLVTKLLGTEEYEKENNRGAIS